MDKMISAINIKKYDYISTNSDDPNISELTDLKKINFFVGANNSGKSRLLRKILSDDVFEYLTSNIELPKVNNAIREFKRDTGIRLSRKIPEITPFVDQLSGSNLCRAG